MTVEFLELTDLLGRALVDEKVRDTLRRFDGPCDDWEDLGSIFKRFKADGVCILAEEKNKPRGMRKRGGRPICAVFLYSEGEGDGYENYLGALPGGVKFGDSLNTVVKKLGEPLKIMHTNYGPDAILLRDKRRTHFLYRLENFNLNYDFDEEDSLISVGIFQAQSRKRIKKQK